jgi:hypothetical protein
MLPCNGGKEGPCLKPSSGGLARGKLWFPIKTEPRTPASSGWLHPAKPVEGKRGMEREADKGNSESELGPMTVTTACLKGIGDG